jgi:hypothetical protein
MPLRYWFAWILCFFNVGFVSASLAFVLGRSACYAGGHVETSLCQLGLCLILLCGFMFLLVFINPDCVCSWTESLLYVALYILIKVEGTTPMYWIFIYHSNIVIFALHIQLLTPLKLIRFIQVDLFSNCLPNIVNVRGLCLCGPCDHVTRVCAWEILLVIILIYHCLFYQWLLWFYCTCKCSCGPELGRPNTTTDLLIVYNLHFCYWFIFIIYSFIICVTGRWWLWVWILIWRSPDPNWIWPWRWSACARVVGS